MTLYQKINRLERIDTVDDDFTSVTLMTCNPLDTK